MSQKGAQAVTSTKFTSTCLHKADADEPIFVLRATDALAPQAVTTWAERAAESGVSQEKVDGALEIAAAMLRWQAKHGRKTPD